MKKQSNLSRLLGYAGGFRYLTYASWILSAFSALIALVPFLYLWKIIDEVLAVMPDFSKAENLIHNGYMAFLFALISMIIYIGALMCSHLAAFRIQSNLRITMMKHIARLPLGFVENFGSGKLRKTVNEASASTETYLAHQLPDKAGAITTPLGLIALLFFFDWRLSLLCIVPIIISFLIMMTMAGPTLKDDMVKYQKALDDMSNEAVEYVRGIPIVKTFGQTVFSFKRFKSSIDRYTKWTIAYTNKLRLPMMGYTTAINGIFAFLIAAALIFTANGITREFLINLLFYIIITPIISVTMTKIMFQSENAIIVDDALSRMDTVLNMKPLSVANDFQKPKDNSIELRNVTHSYDGQTNALQHISLKINPGETVAFVGPSGGGKSTLANVISRFFDLSAGDVFIGGVNVKNIKKEELMNTISFVFQNSRLIKASIYENVKMGKPDATREEVLAALKKAQCTDIIEKLPKGIDTVIGTNGIYLSGGEKQRIAIARVMLKNTPIIILDEATAFADPDNETKVQKAFLELAKGKTVIMIAHRLSTVTGANRIFVIKEGQIAEEGDFPTLSNGGGLFRQMWDNYQKSVKWKVSKDFLEDEQRGELI